MRPDQLNSYRTVSDPQLHPDGVSIAFVVARADFEADCYHSQIWRWDGTVAEPVTEGPHDSAPRWAPDGDTLAYLTAESCEDDPQLAVLRRGDTEPVILTEFPLGAEQPAWSPTGDSIAVIGTSWVDEGLDDDERKNQVRRITRVPYRADDRGWTHDRRSHVYVVAVTDGEVRCITPGDFDEGDFTWTPDGRAITLVSARHAASRDRRRRRS